MAQPLLKDPVIVSGPVRTGTGTGSLSVDKLTHFTTAQTYTATCIAKTPDTLFSIVGSLDGPVGIATVGIQFRDDESKIFLTIQQGATSFEIADKFVVGIANGTDLHQDNIDDYDELPQKNFGLGVKGSLSGDHNIRFLDALVAAQLYIQDLHFTAAVSGPNGNNVQIQYLAQVAGVQAFRTIQDLLYTAVAADASGNGISIEYIEWTPGVKAERTIQQIKYKSKFSNASGNAVSITYVNDVTAGSEFATIAGNAITVHFQSGVSTANAIISMFNATPAVFAVADATLNGANVAQSAPVAAQFLTGGTNPIGDAGSEVVSVTGSAISVTLRGGVSTATQVKAAVDASLLASALVSTTITGTASNAQTTPVLPTLLTGGADGIGAASPAVQVTSNLIQIYFRSGVHTAAAIKSAFDANASATALASVVVEGIGTSVQYSPKAAANLYGGLAKYFSLNQKELTDVPNFYEGNASAKLNDLRVQGNLQVDKHATFNNPVSLADSNSGPTIPNTQEAINSLIANGKLTVHTTGNAAIRYASGQLFLSADLKVSFRDSSIVNTVLAGTFNLGDGQSLYIELNRSQSATQTPAIVTQVPQSSNSFRICTRVGSRLIWFNGNIQNDQDIVRVGGSQDYRANVFGVLTGGGTVAHSGTTLGLLTWSAPILLKQLGSSAQITMSEGSIQLADGEIAYVELDDPFVTATKPVLKAAISAYDLNRADRYWVFHRDGSKIHDRTGGTIVPGEESSIGQEISDDLFAYIGSAGEVDNDPDYQNADTAPAANRFVTDGDNLTKSIKRLDTRAGVQTDIVNQDRAMRLINGGTWSWSGTALTWSAAANVQVPSVADSANLIAAGTASIAADSVLYVTVNRSGAGGTLTVSTATISGYVHADNRFILARRSGTVCYLADGTLLQSTESKEIGSGLSIQNRAFAGVTSEFDSSPNYSGATGATIANRYLTDAEKLTLGIKRLDIRAGVEADIEAQDRNTKLILGGNWSWDQALSKLAWDAIAYVSIPGLDKTRNTIQIGNVTLADGDAAYVTLNRAAGAAANLTVSVAAMTAVTLSDNLFVLARRQGNDVVVGQDTLLQNGDVRLLGAGGGGTGLAVVKMLNAVDTTLPTASGTLIDGQSIVDLDRVLFTNLSNPAQNNRIYKASVTGPTVSWTLLSLGQDKTGAPTGGDLVYVRLGTVYADLIFGYSQTAAAWLDYLFTHSANRTLSNLQTTSINQDLIPQTHNTKDLGTAAVRWRAAYAETAHVTALRKGTSTRFVEETYIDGQTLTGGSTAVFAPFTFSTLVHKAVRVEYVIYDPTSGGRKHGTLGIVVDGAAGVAATNCSITDRSTETADPGVTFTAAISGNNLEVTATTTAGNKTLHAEIKKFLG